ncbi:hypothetical protein HNR25_004749 [Streptomonospora salina]|uniref:Uncharacterized protein n=1 Tax=Streptomonospora salina TaxID=104205 RepID=A0A841EKR3_9ACTN|nr:hypothetical protein [Streptomonospora salina]
MKRRDARPPVLLFTENETLASRVERQLDTTAAVTRVDATRSGLEAALRMDTSSTVLLDPLSGQEHVDRVPHWLARIGIPQNPTAGALPGEEPLTGLGALVGLHEHNAAERTVAFFGTDRFSSGEQLYAAACAWVLGADRIVHPKRQGRELHELVSGTRDTPDSAPSRTGRFAESLEEVPFHLEHLLDSLEGLFAKPAKARRASPLLPWRPAAKPQEAVPRTEEFRSWLHAVERSRGNMRALAQYTGCSFTDLLALEEKELRRRIDVIENFSRRTAPTDGTALFTFVTDRMEVFRDPAFADVWEIRKSRRRQDSSPGGASETPVGGDQDQSEDDEESSGRHAGGDGNGPTDDPRS